MWLREWRVSSRLARTPWLVAGTGVTMAGILLFGALTSSSQPSSVIGRTLFNVNFSLTALFVTLFGPALAANTIALEREGKTWEALVMAGVTPRAIDRGKFWGAYTHLAVYLLALLPSAGIPHLFGGVSYVETLLALVMVFVLGALTVRFGIVVSAIVPSTRAALLVTLCAAAILCCIVMAIGFGATELLRQDLGMRSLDGEGPVFWPVALVHEPLSFNYARYLIVVPLGGVAVSWFALRELTAYALDTTSGDRPHRGSYLALIGALAVLLGLLPDRLSDATILIYGLFSVCSFIGIVVVATDRPLQAKSTTGRSVLLLVAGSAGFFVIFAITSVTQMFSNGFSSSREEIVENLLFYGPAFTVFVTGLTAFVRTLCRSTSVARLITVAITLGIAIVPLIIAVFVKAAGGYADLVIALSPFAASIRSEGGRSGLVCAATWWGLFGAALLTVTHRREVVQGMRSA